jgi:hypothetical protein
MRLEEIIQDNFIVFVISETLIIKTLSSRVQNSLQKKQNEFPRITFCYIHRCTQGGGGEVGGGGRVNIVPPSGKFQNTC